MKSISNNSTIIYQEDELSRDGDIKIKNKERSGSNKHKNEMKMKIENKSVKNGRGDRMMKNKEASPGDKNAIKSKQYIDKDDYMNENDSDDSDDMDDIDIVLNRLCQCQTWFICDKVCNIYKNEWSKTDKNLDIKCDGYNCENRINIDEYCYYCKKCDNVICVKCIKNVQYVNQADMSRDKSNCNDNNGNKNKDKICSRKEKIQFENLNLLQQISGLSESSTKNIYITITHTGVQFHFRKQFIYNLSFKFCIHVSN